jgi:hemerythrin-like metal-binding protein
MAYFEWGDDMVIDHGPIDQDHRKLVDLVNELHTATTAGQGRAVVGKIMSELIFYTNDHLVREEQEMERLGFPNLEEHKRHHAEFMAGIHQLVDKQAKGSITVASQLSTLLRDWLSIHIRRSDRELRVYLKQLNRRKKDH